MSGKGVNEGPIQAACGQDRDGDHGGYAEQPSQDEPPALAPAISGLTDGQLNAHEREAAKRGRHEHGDYRRERQIAVPPPDAQAAAVARKAKSSIGPR
jgi:hypothetical protein